MLRAGVGAAKGTGTPTFPMRFPLRLPRRANRTTEGGTTLTGDTRHTLDVAQPTRRVTRQPAKADKSWANPGGLRLDRQRARRL